MSLFVFSRNGMGDYTLGTGMREDMHMQAFNIFLDQAGVVLSGDMAVSVTSPTSMAVKVAAGRCFVPNTAYVVNTPNKTKYWGILAEETTVSVDTNTSGSTRIDLVTVFLDTVPAANGYATNVASIVVVKGIPGAGTPTLPDNSLLLATLTIPTATTIAITGGMIADSRAFVSLNSSPSNVIKTFDTEWQGSVSDPVIGDAELTMQYVDLGSIVHVQTSAENLYNTPDAGKELDTWGEGDMSFTLPFTASAIGYGMNFIGEFLTTGDTYTKQIVGKVAPGTNILQIYYLDPSTNYNELKKLTWSSFGDGLTSASDYLRLTGFYFKV